MPIKVIMKSIYGSHLYGTSTPTSDMDYKQIHMNPLDLILIGKDSGCFNENTNSTGRNSKDDVDFESKEVRTFIRQALEGQSYAMDMLFTPDHLILERSELWDEIVSMRSQLVNRNVKPIVSYVRAMTMKYSNKGVKYNELKSIIEIFEKLEPKMSLKELMESENPIDFSKYKYCQYYDKVLDSGDMKSSEKYADITTVSFPSSRKIFEMLPVVREVLKSYGNRVKDASVYNVDLKALMHAMRLCFQLDLYLTTGKLEFPHPRVQDLIDIRLGKYSREHVEEWLTSEIDRVMQIPNELPEANYDKWNNWLLDKYMQQAHEQSSEYLKLRGLLK